ncbi:hypothetical protein DSUL_50134 [Desulfovibrionales bacterium]
MVLGCIWCMAEPSSSIVVDPLSGIVVDSSSGVKSLHDRLHMVGMYTSRHGMIRT